MARGFCKNKKISLFLLTRFIFGGNMQTKSVMYHTMYHGKERENMLSTEVYSALLDKLLSRELLPGQIINRRDVAIQLGTSTSPVLEAMKQLEYEGYLETIPRKGTQVKLIDEKEVIGSYLTRIGLEGIAVRMGFVLGTIRERYDELKMLAEKAESIYEERHNHAETWKADSAFHCALVGCCENPKIIDSFERISLSNIFYRTSFVFINENPDFHNSHVALIKKIANAKTADEAEKEIRIHIAGGRSILSDFAV